MANKSSRASLAAWVLLVMIILSFAGVAVRVVNSDRCDGKEVLGIYPAPYESCWTRSCTDFYGSDGGCNVKTCASQGIQNTVKAEDYFEPAGYFTLCYCCSDNPAT
ncbi:hypothetical protein MKW94_001007 [Papaver nudicaule]|uniref:Uncharacterized protein n=1 Tax=Papaver nudicaule TaxID=74823 RepID=A0AA41RTK7_PAPNU|nr:hypothetical protein [Papaver nudicaule]